MQQGLTMICGGGVENRELGTGDAASRCSLPFERGGRLIRDAGFWPQLAVGMRMGARIKVAWAQKVSWEVTIRFTKPC